jgi:protein O-mannosyl-transferase
VRVRFQLLLVCAAVLAAYCPSFSAGLCPIDDLSMVQWLRGTTPADFASQLVPSSLLYYRPVIGVSYFVDKYLLGLNSGLMHLHNVLLHCADAVLVFLVARKLLAPKQRQGSYLPLAAALLFGLHPVNAESVNWISGRTDVLSLFFLLLSTLFLLGYRETRTRRDFLLAGAAFLVGFLTKETSIAFAAGFVLIWSARREEAPDGLPAPSPGLWRRSTPALFVLACALAAYLALQYLAYRPKPGSLGLTLRFLLSDWTHTCLVIARAFGFYLKKLLIPYPLNFAINDLDPLYELLGIPLAFICLYIASRRTMVSAFFTTGMLLMTPAFLLAFNQVAWTPYAERYIYMTSAFVVIAALFYLRDNLVLPDARVGTACVAALVLVMGVTTLQRSFIWQDNFRLCEDTVRKSPLSRDMRVLYGGLFADRGDLENTRIQTEAANAIPGLGYDDRADNNLVVLFIKRGELDRALEVCESSLRKSKGSSTTALQNLVSVWEIKGKGASGSAKTAIDRKLFQYHLTLFKLAHDPCQLYALGEISRSLGEKQKALVYYRHAYDNMTSDNSCRKLAEGAVRSLTGQGI